MDEFDDDVALDELDDLDDLDELDDEEDSVEGEAEGEEEEDEGQEGDEVDEIEESGAENIVSISSSSKAPASSASRKRLHVHVVPPDERRTSDMMSLHELAAVVGVRAQQIDNGDVSYCRETHHTKAIKIAEQEILEKRCPLTVERTVLQRDDHIYVEHFSVNELAVPILNLGDD